MIIVVKYIISNWYNNHSPIIKLAINSITIQSIMQ